MGQIAEDMQDGSCCSFCGQYFRSPSGKGIYVHEYPVACNECWEKDCGVEKQDKGVQTY